MSNVFELSRVNGVNGVGIITHTNLRYGQPAASAGDVNGDGVADVIIGARLATSSNGGYAAGRTYLIFGHRGPWNERIDTRRNYLNGTTGVIIVGIHPSDSSGFSVAPAGDVNGDGVADVIIGATQQYPYSDGVYIIFGCSEVFGCATRSPTITGSSSGSPSSQPSLGPSSSSPSTLLPSWQPSRMPHTSLPSPYPSLMPSVSFPSGSPSSNLMHTNDQGNSGTNMLLVGIVTGVVGGHVANTFGVFWLASK